MVVSDRPKHGPAKGIAAQLHDGPAKARHGTGGVGDAMTVEPQLAVIARRLRGIMALPNRWYQKV